jgi:DNA-binding IclR family transcriptional regulator
LTKPLSPCNYIAYSANVLHYKQDYQREIAVRPRKPESNGGYKTLKDLSKILSYVSSVGTETIGITETAKELHMLPSKVSRMLSTLESEGFFERRAATGRYSIGGRFFELGMLYVVKNPLRMIFHPHLEQITAELKLASSFAIFRNNKIIVVDKINIVGSGVRHDFNLPLHSSSFGKIYLASFSDDQALGILKASELTSFTSATITDPKIIIRGLAQIRKSGYAIDTGETQEGLTSIAVPVRDAANNLVAALNVLAYPKSPIGPERQSEIANYLKAKAFFISKQLGYAGSI